MMTRQRCVLLDAMVVIHLHQLGVWADFISKYDVTLPETVVSEAAYHSADELTGNHVAIDLAGDIDSGRITVLSATQHDLLDVGARLPSWLIIDPGETEAIALLSKDPDLEDCLFCTADQAAVKASVMLGIGERCSSLQHLLSGVGMTKSLPHHYTDDTLKMWVDAAQRDRIQWM
ncbi:MAG TPA: hypothetical protein DCP20_06510 [Coriobacteriia bacterium]|nr:hypothetical protein [Coriobacteriia bacterium]